MAKTARTKATVQARAVAMTKPAAMEAKPAAPAVQTAPAPAQAAAPAVNSAPTSGTAASGDISAYYGKKYMYGPPSTKKIAITFDDGPYAKTTPVVLEILKQEGITATFFMLGESVEKYPEMAKQVADAGYEIGCHTTSHANLRTKSSDVIHNEVVGTAKYIEQVTGKKPHVFRPPYGEYNQFVLKSCAEGEMVMVTWSVDTNDWRKGTSPESIHAACMRQTKGGSVILMHDTHAKSVQALPGVIKELKSKGFQFVTLSDLIAESLKHKMMPGADGAGGGMSGMSGMEEGAPVAAKPASIPLNQSAWK